MMLRRGVSRRAVLKFGAVMTAALALPAVYEPRVTRAVTRAARLPLIWLHGQGCGGDSEALLQTTNPTTADLFIQTLSVDYDEALMASSAAARQLEDVIAAHQRGYIAVIEGATPTADDGIYVTVGGRAFRDVVAEVTANALATVAVGSCAFDGGLAAAGGGSTGAVGAGQVVRSSTLINLPGCPVNASNLAATVVHYYTFGQFPPTDALHRPLFAYGGLIHNQCERRAHFEFGEFVTEWGDEAAQKGWCLYKMGCKGPETFANCPTAKYADGASWSVLAGHGCIGCTMPGFWDAMGSAYARLPAPVPFLADVTADQIGLTLVGGVGGLAVAHGAASVVRQKIVGRARPRAAQLPNLPSEAPTDEPIAEEMTAEELPAEETPAEETPVANATSEEPAAEEPAADRPTAEEPAADEPAADKPAPDEPTK